MGGENATEYPTGEPTSSRKTALPNSARDEPVTSEANSEKHAVATMISTDSTKPAKPAVEEPEEPDMEVEVDQDIVNNDVDFVEQNDNFDDELETREQPLSSSNPLAYSLAMSPHTPLWAKILLPILCLCCHAIFYYGQTAPMWKLRTFAEIDAWANATDVRIMLLIGKRFYCSLEFDGIREVYSHYKTCSHACVLLLFQQFTSRTAFDTVGLPREMNFKISEDKDVETFTYYYAIDHLWVAKGLPGKTLPRAAAILLIIFSGFWPHIKLLLLNITWFCGKYPTRTKHLQWLSTLGKWSLADVLVVCVMVGVLHLDWVVVPGDIKQGVITDLPQIIAVVKSLYDHRALCDKLLKLQCAHEKNVVKKAKCHGA